MNRSFAEATTISRILTATRMAIDLGYREDAVIMLNLLFGFFESSQEFSVDEPFLSVSERMATVDPGGDIGSVVGICGS